MLLFPAIDLMGGQVVRLRQGLAGEKTVYPADPAEVARRWQEEGGHYLHVVDLDAAFSGAAGEANRAAIGRIARAVTIPVELGGGMRSEEAARAAFDLGISRIVIGTRAAESMEFVAEMAAAFGPARVAVGIDARDGVVAVKGWTQSAGRRAIDVAREAQSAGAGALIYTDIATDGMLAGPNFAELKTLLDQLTIPLIASGGVTTAEDVRKLAAWPKLHGVIIGRALYEETLRLADCLPWVN
jgi:phosphoribosylformimino-5-aminoimidazole carboxamide ribotide isomerase